jgi:hypothetical protein
VPRATDAPSVPGMWFGVGAFFFIAILCVIAWVSMRKRTRQWEQDEGYEGYDGSEPEPEAEEFDG